MKIIILFLLLVIPKMITFDIKFNKYNLKTMANIEKYTPKVLQFEGGYVNDKCDSGGATNMGVTINTWKAMGDDKDGDGIITENDIKLLTIKDFELILFAYWDKWKANLIKNQSIAEILVDFYWGSGNYGIKIPQKVLGVNPDGIVGNKTIAAINDYPNQKELFDKLQAARLHFIDDIIVNRPLNKKFEKGWKRRINSFKYSII